MRFMTIALCIFAAMTGQLRAETPLIDRVPEGAFLYAGWAGRTMAFDGAYAGQLLQEFPLDDIRRTIETAIATKTDSEQQRVVMAAAFDMVLTAMKHPAVFFVQDIVYDGGTGYPVGAIQVDLGRDREAFAAQLDAIYAQLAGMVTIEDERIAGVACKKIVFDRESEPLRAGFLGDVFFLAMGPQTVGSLAALRDSSEASLANNESFAGVFEDVGGDDIQSAFFLDIPRLLDQIERIALAEGELAPGELKRNMEMLGLARLGPVASVTRVRDRRMFTRTRIVSPGPHQGIMKLFAPDAPVNDDVSDLPVDTEMLVMANIDLKALLAEVRRLAAMQDPQQAANLEQGLMMASSFLGLSLEEKILANLGPRVMLVQAESLGGPFAGLVLMIDIKDTESFSLVRARLEAMATGIAQAQAANGMTPPFKLIPQTVGDAEVTCLHLTKMPLPIVPSWTIAGDKLIVSPWPQPVMTVAAGRIATGLEATEAYAGVRRYLSGRPVGMSYADISKSLPRVYPLAMLLGSMAANAVNGVGLEASASWLPPLATLRRYALPGICGIWSDEGGLLIESIGMSTGGGDMTVAPTALSMSILMPALGRARALARQTGSAANLRGIGQAIYIYEASHDDAMPESLDELVREVSLDTRMLVSPSTGNRYVYIPVPSNAGDRLIMAYDPPAMRDADVAVLFRNSSVMRIPRDEFQMRLEASRRAAGQPTGQDSSGGPASRPMPRPRSGVKSSDF